jgi:hypothetical protein
MGGWLIGKHALQLAAVRADTPSLDIDDPHTEEVLADVNAPSAQAIELRTACLQFDGGFGKHLGVLTINDFETSESQVADVVRQFLSV